MKSIITWNSGSTRASSVKNHYCTLLSSDAVMSNKGMKSSRHSRWLDMLFERLNSEEGEHVICDGLGFLSGGQAIDLEEAVDEEVGVTREVAIAHLLTLIMV